MSESTTLIIFGITGDLATKKLLPAILELQKANAIPKKFRIIGITRREIDTVEFIKKIAKSGSKKKFLERSLMLFQMDPEEKKDYIKLKKFIKTITKNSGQQLYYLSVPPTVSPIIIKNLGASSISKNLKAKLLLEKPFGTDLKSAQILVKILRRCFKEEQLYLIDHFLAKEMAQNILVFRGGNSLFKRSWSKEFIEKIEIIASEEIDIEGRAVFYEQTGALRDIVQSHMLQLLALTLMDLPEFNNFSQVPKKRLEALSKIKKLTLTEIKKSSRRGQYGGYKEEVNNNLSSTETFVSVTFFSKDKKWKDVPVTLITGKALDKKLTEIRIHYKKENKHESNQLILRIQPREGIEIYLWVKKPGFENQMEMLPLHVTYKDHYKSLPEAYERVLLDAIRSDHTLFTSSEEIITSWKILSPLQNYWKKGSADLVIYRKGSSSEEILYN